MSDERLRPPGAGIDDDELEELRASVSALRDEIEGRFGTRRRRLAYEAAAADELAEHQGAQTEARATEEPGLLATLGRRMQEGFGELDLVQIYDELRDRLSTPGRADVSPGVDEFGLDERYLARARLLLDFLYERWWRVESIGAEKIPDVARVLFVANRSGILPYDGMMISHAVERGHPSGKRPRFLVADWLMTLPFSQPALARVGGVRASSQNAENLLRRGHWVVAFPEGQKGAIKNFTERYRLQRFGRGGFVSLAVRERAVVVPVAVVGAEEIHPILFQPRLPRRLLGTPLPVTPTFPLLGPLGFVPLPSQWRIRFGDPFHLDQVDLAKADDPLYVNRTREQVRGAIQALLEDEVHRRRSVFT